MSCAYRAPPMSRLLLSSHYARPLFHCLYLSVCKAGVLPLPFPQNSTRISGIDLGIAEGGMAKRDQLIGRSKLCFGRASPPEMPEGGSDICGCSAVSARPSCRVRGGDRGRLRRRPVSGADEDEVGSEHSSPPACTVGIHGREKLFYLSLFPPHTTTHSAGLDHRDWD